MDDLKARVIGRWKDLRRSVTDGMSDTSMDRMRGEWFVSWQIVIQCFWTWTLSMKRLRDITETMSTILLDACTVLHCPDTWKTKWVGGAVELISYWVTLRDRIGCWYRSSLADSCYIHKSALYRVEANHNLIALQSRCRTWVESQSLEYASREAKKKGSLKRFVLHD